MGNSVRNAFSVTVTALVDCEEERPLLRFRHAFFRCCAAFDCRGKRHRLGGLFCARQPLYEGRVAVVRCGDIERDELVDPCFADQRVVFARRRAQAARHLVAAGRAAELVGEVVAGLLDTVELAADASGHPVIAAERVLIAVCMVAIPLGK